MPIDFTPDETGNSIRLKEGVVALFMKCQMRPLPCVVRPQPADRVELQDLMTQVIEVILWILHVIPHGLPFLPKFVEEHIELFVPDA